VKSGVVWCLVVTSILTCPCLGEFQVNTRTSDGQADAAVAMDANGNFVVVWSSYRGDGDSGSVFGRRFDANCEPMGDEFQINTTTAGNQTEPAVAMDASGNFVVVWHGPGVTEEDIFARRFDSNGQHLGDEFGVNTCTDSRQLCPSVAMNNDGNFVVVWESMDIPEEGKKAICGQLYDSSGSSVGPEFVVNDEPSTCRYPDVAMHSSGRFVVVWVRDGTLKSVWVRHFEADGNAPYLGSKVNDDFNFTSLTQPAVAIDAIGNYVIAWDGHRTDYLEDDIYLKRYHWSHAPIHDQFLVNTYQAGGQRNPSIAMNEDGQFVVTWQSDTGTEGTKEGIFGQRFPSQGEHIGEPILLGDEFRINTYRPDDQRYPAVVMGRDGEFVAVWQSDEQDGSDYGVFGEIGPRIGCADFSGDSFVNFGDYSVLAGEWLEEGNGLEADLMDDNRIDEKDLWALCEQWLRPCYDCNEVDVYTDGKIDFKDYGLWARNWLKRGPNFEGDVTGDGIVDMVDLQAMVFHWTKACE